MHLSNVHFVLCQNFGLNSLTPPFHAFFPTPILSIASTLSELKWAITSPKNGQAMQRYSGRKKAHQHKLFVLVNVQMALGQTAGCPRVNRAKKFMFALKHRKYKFFSLVNRRVVPGLSRLSTKSLCVQSLYAFFLP